MVNRFSRFAYFFGLWLFSMTVFAQKPALPSPPPHPMKPVPSKPVTTIAFGSCNKVEKPQDYWYSVVLNNPNLWIWLGDIIYADTEDMEVMEAMYKKQKNQTSYRKLISTCPIMGTWDDHDFGENDADKYYPQKEKSRQLLLDFLGYAPSAPIRKRPGMYTSVTFGPPEKSIKVILLDTRYWRDSLVKGVSGKYEPNITGNLLGDEQWTWLEDELKESNATINIIGSSIGVLSRESKGENWSNFPKAKKRLFDLIIKTKSDNVLLISGDTHFFEMSKATFQGVVTPLYEVTSSGLTHTSSIQDVKNNPLRIGEAVVKKNFGLLHFDWQPKSTIVTVEGRGLGNEVIYSQKISFVRK
jgi:alkaline phosphatase D